MSEPNVERSSRHQEFKRPPERLAAPAWLPETVALMSREADVLGQGFTESQLKTAWWKQRGIDLRLAGKVLREGQAKAAITRQQLFDLGSKAVSEPSDEELVLDYAWHVLAWGGGTSRRHMDARIASLTTPGRDGCLSNARLLGEAIALARHGEVRGAYSCLIRPGGSVIKGLGPAFFTKILYFATGAGGRRDGSQCQILDARVAQSLHAAGWKISPNQGYSWNWYTTTYENYCELLAYWARQLGDDIEPDMLELALFRGPPTT